MQLRSFLLTAVCCLWAINTNAQTAQILPSDFNAQNVLAEALEKGSILVCKAGQCVQTNHNMSREYLFNQLKSLADANIGQDIEICEGDSTTRQCVQKGISLLVASPAIQTIVQLPKARLIDARPVKDTPGIDLIIDYKMKAGGTFPHCQTTLSRLGTRHAGSSELMSPHFNCALTETGKTLFSIAYHIDYIDFDQGIIGAQYTIAADNVLTGANAGYVLMDFAKGVKMEPGETYPYPEQLAALESGEVATFDTPTDIEAVWLKPTPFLNLLTPTFAPNDCYTFEGGCSAQMLNNPSRAVPPAYAPADMRSGNRNVPPAQAKLDALTPPNVASTTGLIQQTMTVTPASPAERQTITTKTKVAENGKIIYSEEATRHYVRETANGPLVEDKSKAVVQSSGQMPNEETVKNAEKEYAAMKQFEAQTQKALTAGTSVAIQPTQHASAQSKSSSGAIADIATSAKTTQPTAPRPLGQPITQTNVEVIVPDGVVLTEAERAYIEQLAASAEGKPLPLPNIQPEITITNNGNGSDVALPSATGTTPNNGVYQQAPLSGNNQARIGTQPQGVLPQHTQMQQLPVQGAMHPAEQATIPVIGPNSSTVSNQPITITSDTTPVKEEQTSFWDSITDNISKWLYF